MQFITVHKKHLNAYYFSWFFGHLDSTVTRQHWVPSIKPKDTIDKMQIEDPSVMKTWEGSFNSYVDQFCPNFDPLPPSSGQSWKWKLWQYSLWSFQTVGTKLGKILLKNLHTQMKLLNFENWVKPFIVWCGFHNSQKFMIIYPGQVFNLTSNFKTHYPNLLFFS